MITGIHFAEHKPGSSRVEAKLQLEHEGVSYHVQTVSKRVHTFGNDVWKHSITGWQLGEGDVDAPKRPEQELPDDVAAEAYACLEGSRWA